MYGAAVAGEGVIGLFAQPPEDTFLISSFREEPGGWTDSSRNAQLSTGDGREPGSSAMKIEISGGVPHTAIGARFRFARKGTQGLTVWLRPDSRGIGQAVRLLATNEAETPFLSSPRLLVEGWNGYAWLWSEFQGATGPFIGEEVLGLEFQFDAKTAYTVWMTQLAGETEGMVGEVASLQIIPAQTDRDVGWGTVFQAIGQDQKGIIVTGALEAQWEVSPPTLGEVDKNGVFWAKSAGKGKVIASVQGVRASEEVIVSVVDNSPDQTSLRAQAELDRIASARREDANFALGIGELTALRQNYPGQKKVSSEAQFLLAHYHNFLRQPREAAQATLQVVKDYPEEPWQVARALYYTGGFLESAQDYEAAMEAYRRVLEKHNMPHWEEAAHFALGCCFLRLQKWQQAQSTFKEFLRNYPDSAREAETRVLLQSISQTDLQEQSPVIFLGEDRSTQGQWPLRYGAYAYILCGMWGYNLGGGSGWPIAYQTSTGDPEVRVARWTSFTQATPDPRALWNPRTRRRTWAGWGDQGELHPCDGKGPDLLLDLTVPEGVFRLSLFWADRDHFMWAAPFRYTVAVWGKRQQLLTAFNSGLCGEGVYTGCLVRGPQKITLRVYKGANVCATLSGVFLDQVKGPRPVPAWLSATPPALVHYWAAYENARRSWQSGSMEGRCLETWRALGNIGEKKTPEGLESPLARYLAWQSATQVMDYSRAETQLGLILHQLTTIFPKEQVIPIAEDLAKAYLFSDQPWVALRMLEWRMKQAINPEEVRKIGQVLAPLYTRLGLDEAAMAVYRRLVTKKGDALTVAQAFYHLAVLLMVEERWPEARKMFQDLQERFADTPEGQLAGKWLEKSAEKEIKESAK